MPLDDDEIVDLRHVEQDDPAVVSQPE